MMQVLMASEATSFLSLYTVQACVLLFPLGVCITWLVLNLYYAMLKESRLPFDSSHAPRLAVIVPAYNEELGIARTIEGLLALDYCNLEIHVVSDGSQDATDQVVRQYAGDGVVLHTRPVNGGKAACLQYALERVDAELFMVVDADTVPNHDAMTHIVQQFRDPDVAGVTGNLQVHRRRSVLTLVQSLEYSVIIGFMKRSDSVWGGLMTVSGAAACFRTSALRAVGGWASWSATEDIEMSWRLQHAGYRLAYEPRALFTIQAPPNYISLFRQRRRWAQGMIEVLRRHGNVMRSANPALIPLFAQAALGLAWAALIIPTLLWMLLTGSPAFMTGGALAATCALFFAQAFTACVLDSHYRKETMTLLLLAPLYPLYFWGVTMPSLAAGAVRGLRSRDAGRWNRTDRVAANEDESPVAHVEAVPACASRPTRRK